MSNVIAQTTVIIIRHGEREDPNPADPNDDPHLNADGIARAQTLLHVLGRAGIRGIYTSKYLRTKETAAPLAAQLALTPTVINDAVGLKNNILQKFPGKTVLVLGHTDTIPELIKQLGGGNIGVIEAHEFDNLFIVTILGPGKAKTLALKYGRKS